MPDSRGFEAALGLRKDRPGRSRCASADGKEGLAIGRAAFSIVLVDDLAKQPRQRLAFRVGSSRCRCIAIDQRERVIDRDVDATFADRHDKLRFVMQTGGLGRISYKRPIIHQGVGRFVKEERRFPLRILAHLAGMGLVVATDAEYLALREACHTSCDRD